MQWFDVDKEGLAKLLERRGAANAVLELVQNSLDTDAKNVSLDVRQLTEKDRVRVIVEDDDPTGFVYLAHAWTLFAESTKKGDARKRGRFNLGEKLVLALCETATIATTSGTVLFSESGRTEYPDQQRARGSVFDAIMRLSPDDVATVNDLVNRLLVPKGVRLLYNGEERKTRTPDMTFKVTLPTEVANGDGVLRSINRKTDVALVALQDGETPYLYELGIPVVEWEGTHHVNVGQKVPLNMERNNVSPAYQRNLRVAVLNHTFDNLTPDQTTAPWVGAALADPSVSGEAVAKVLFGRFGDKAVAFDPSDLQANKEAAAKGYVVVGGRTFDHSTWDNIRKAGLLPRAGSVTPSNATVELQGNDAKPVKPTKDQRVILDYAEAVGQFLLDRPVTATVVNDITLSAAAFYSVGTGTITFNIGRLGKAWFSAPDPLAVDALLIHEFAHDVYPVADHLSHKYFDALCDLGARLRNCTYRITDFVVK